MAVEAGVKGTGHWLDRAALAGLLGFAGALQFSIFLAEALLAAALVAWLGALIVNRERPEVPGWFLPLLVYAALTLVATAFSLEPLTSLGAAKQLLLFLLVPATIRAARGRSAETVMDVVLSLGAFSAIVGVIQFGFLGYDRLQQRPVGTLGHWMTYSGLLMLIACSAAARLLFERRNRTWPALIMPALVVALVFTFTRSAWVGACVGIGLLLVLKDFRLLALAPVVAGLFFALAPASIASRFYSIFDLHDPSNRDRVAMFAAGAEIVASDPLTGVGPNLMQRVYPDYRKPNAVEQTPPHLHNVPLQIAAERGLPALAVWIWFLVAVVRDLLRKLRADRPRYLAAAALSAVGAMVAAGFFEYNFGDSEFLMLLLLLLALPWAASASPARRPQGEPAA
ncbi:MAG TPA: O-antigen ligase family protein [Vicinamibacterales bacterium]|nr:O-antigen ligase family protein [Acidobacteriota bacterium]HOC17520.1 O-antigen ligase family protein [Vicinamibacterales bacterium]